MFTNCCHHVDVHAYACYTTEIPVSEPKSIQRAALSAPTVKTVWVVSAKTSALAWGLVSVKTGDPLWQNTHCAFMETAWGLVSV